MNAAQQLRELVYATGRHELASMRLERASEIFRFMTMFAPDDERAWLGLGEAHRQAGHEEVALFVLDAGRRLARNSGRCHLALSRAHHEHGESERALEMLETAKEHAIIDSDEELEREIERVRRNFQ